MMEENRAGSAVAQAAIILASKTASDLPPTADVIAIER